MCVSSKVPEPPKVREAPQRDESAAAVADERRRLSGQQGIYGNIFTSTLGDPGYGQNTQRRNRVAAFGG